MQQLTSFVKRVIALVTFVVAVMQLYKLLKESGILAQLQTSFNEFKRDNLLEPNVPFELSEDIDNVSTATEVVANKEDLVVKVAETKPAKTVKSTIKAKKSTKTAAVSPRAKTLLNYIKSRKQITVAEIRDQFPTVTARTLRRDLDKLEKQGVIAQTGKTRNSAYHFVA
jgi:predicted HTH transcriptional regulator